MPKSLKVGIWTFIGSFLFLMFYGFQSVLVAAIGALLIAIFGVLLALPLPDVVKSGLLTGIIGLVFVIAYAVERPAIALLGAMITGVSAALMASYRQHKTDLRAGAIQGALAGAVGGALTAIALFLVWLYIVPAAGVTNIAYAKLLSETIPLGASLGSDVAIIGWLSALTLLISMLLGALMGMARTVEGVRGNLLSYAILGLVVLLIPILDRQTELQLLNAFIPVFVFILLALGLNIVVGYAGLLDLGYAAFFAIGAYTTGMLSSPLHDTHWNFWLVIWIAAAVAACAGVILGAPTLPLRGDYLAIVTLGFGEIVPILFRNLGGGGPNGSLTLKLFGGQLGTADIAGFTVMDQVNLTGGVAGINPIDPPKLPGIVFGPQNQVPWFYLLVAIMMLTLFLINRLRGSRQGRAWTALREDELAADAMGINTVRTKLLAFAMGATFSGFAGAFYGAYVSAIFPTSFDFSVSIIVLCMVILGGLGNMAGVIVGGLLIMGADRLILPQTSNLIRKVVQHQQNTLDLPTYRDITQWRLLLFGMVLVLMMLVRPEGLLPNARRRAELHPDEDTAEQENATLFDAERDPQLAGH